jgi:CRP/FNR family transcriptional regulator, cyclic AMP receptor protein
MSDILDQLQGHPVQRYNAGESIFKADGNTGVLLVLISGALEVRKDGVLVDLVKEPGSVMGEIAALLNTGHSADVIAAEPSSLYVIQEPRKFLREHPDFHLHVSELLAKRLGNLVRYLADVKQQFADHDHIGMVDQVLDTLVLRQPRKRDKGRSVTSPPNPA